MDAPDESATDKKKAAMVKRLERRRTAFLNKWDNRRAQTAVLDLEETERTFVEQQSILEPPPTLNISDISMIGASDTFTVNSPSRRTSGPVTSTPFHPRKKPSFSPRLRIEEAHESYVDIMERQFAALSGWCNTLLNMCNRFEDGIVDLGQTKQDAARKLQEMLTSQRKETSSTDSKKFRYKEAFCQQEFEASKQRAKELYGSSPIPGKIISMVEADHLLIRDNMTVYSDIILKSSLFHAFFSFHPVWLHLGMEIVFDTEINITDGSSFLVTMTNFLNTRLFADPVILKNKKNVHGTVKLLLSDQGRKALHRHFLTKTCQFFFCVEACKTADVIRSDPRLFARRSQFKSLQDVFAEFSREALSSSSLTLNKAFAKIGFEPKYVQNYFDDLEYKVETFADLTDGVHLGKLIEVANKLGRGTVMSRLRNPRGDRLSKISNVATVLQVAASEGIDVKHIDPEQIVRCNHEVILQVLWKIIGVYVVSSGGTSDAAIQELHQLHDQKNIEKARENAATLIQAHARRLLAQKQYQSRLEQLRNRRAVVLQSVIRQFLAQCAVRHRAVYMKDVVKAESYVRRFLARKQFSEVFQTKTIQLEAATLIQAHARRLLAQKQYQSRLEQLRNRRAVVLQSVVRKFLAQCYVGHRVQYAKNVLEAQNYARRFLARKQLREVGQTKSLKLEAVTRIQTNVRRIIAVRTYELRRLESRSSVVLQSIIRQFLAQCDVRHRAVYMKNVVKTESYVRRFLARKRFKEACQTKTVQLEAATLIQAHVRRLRAQKQYQSRREQLRKRSAVVLQSVIRKFLAQSDIRQRAKFVKSIVKAQSYVRRFLACKKFRDVGQTVMNHLEDSINVMSSATPPPARSAPRIPIDSAQCTPTILKTLRRLRQSIGYLQQSNAEHEITLKAIKFEDRKRAAITIQRMWRGYWTRKKVPAVMAHLEAADQQYREEMEINEITMEAHDGRPAFVKLEEYTVMLFDDRLYRTKVAAICIRRLIGLTTQLCHHFSIKCGGLQAVLDRMQQADRSPGEEEIVSELVNIIFYLVEHAQTDAQLQFIVHRHGEFCRKNLFHVFNAFHNNANIVTKSASALLGVKKISPEVFGPNTTAQAKYYITAALRRYNRLPANDSKLLAARSLESSFL